MNFEWDEAKSEVCAKERRFNFSYAALAFYDTHRVIQTDTRRSYGEERFELMGKIDARVYVVIYTKRLEVTRIISARKANPREVKRYENSTNEN